MKNISHWVGVDVSKATLDVYIRPIGKAFKVANSETEIANLVKELQSYNLNLIVLEATGGLETELVILFTCGTFTNSINQSSSRKRFC